MSSQTRVAKLEAMDEPEELFERWFRETQNFESEDAYNRWVAEDPRRVLRNRLQEWIDRRRNDSLARRRARRTFPEIFLRRELFKTTNEIVNRQVCNMRLGLPLIGLHLPALTPIGSRRSYLDTSDSQPCEQVAEAVGSELGNYVETIADLRESLCFWSTAHFGKAFLSATDCEATNAIASILNADGKTSAFWQAVIDLLKKGEIVPSAAVSLDPVPIVLLGNVSLVECNWIDAYIVELSENAAEHEDRLPASDKSSAQIQHAEDEVRRRLGRFAGRTKKIGKRTYWHIGDYRSWPERKSRGSLRAQRGPTADSWDSFVEKNGGDDSQLEGVPIRRILRARGWAERLVYRALAPAGSGAIVDLQVNPESIPAKDAGALPTQFSRIVRQLWLSKLVSERVSERHFKNRPILYEAPRAELERLIASAEHMLDTCAVMTIFGEYRPENRQRGRMKLAPLRIDLGALGRDAVNTADRFVERLEVECKERCALLLQ